MGYKYVFTDYGKKVKAKLLDINKSQNWLIGEIKTRTGLFIDSSLLNKVLTGRLKGEKIVAAIDEIIFENS